MVSFQTACRRCVAFPPLQQRQTKGLPSGDKRNHACHLYKVTELRSACKPSLGTVELVTRSMCSSVLYILTAVFYYSVFFRLTTLGVLLRDEKERPFDNKVYHKSVIVKKKFRFGGRGGIWKAGIV